MDGFVTQLLAQLIAPLALPLSGNAAHHIALGLALSDAPRWMALALWWLALVLAFMQLQRAGR